MPRTISTPDPAGPDAAGGRYEVQARRIVRRGRVVVSDDTRRAATVVHADAVRTATEWAADGFTVWIFVVREVAGIRPVYETVATFPPARVSTAGGGRDPRPGPHNAVPAGHHPTPPTTALRVGEGSAA